MKFTKILITSAILAFSSSSFSEIYFGASAGQSSSTGGDSASDSSYFWYTNVESESSDSTDHAFSIYSGYNFSSLNNNLAIEAGWVSLGESNLTAAGQDFSPGGDGKRSLDITNKTEAITLSVIGKKSIANQLKLFGKLGVSAWDITGDLDGVVNDAAGNQTGSTTRSVSDSGNDIVIGFGLEYQYLTVQFERFKIGESNTNFISVGAKI